MISSLPAELRRLHRWPSSAFLTVALTIAAAIVITAAIGPFVLINSLVTGGMWSLMAVGLALVFGVMNIPNFAHGEFFMVGSFVGYFIFTPLQSATAGSGLLSTIAPIVAMLGAGVAGAGAGVVAELAVFYPLRRRSQQEWVMDTFLLTVGLSVILINGVQLLFGTQYRGITQYWNVNSVDIFGTLVTIDRLATLGVALLAIVVFWLFLKRSRLGRAIRGTAQDEAGAVMVGINPDLIYVVTMSLSCALAALAGASLLYLYPAYPTIGLQPLYVSFFVVILAGLGNIPGAIVGGFIISFVQTITAYYIGEGWVNVIPTLLIIAVLLVKPSGLFGSVVKGVWEQ